MSDARDPLEAEFVALAVVHNALAGLDPAARRRVLLRLCERFLPELPGGSRDHRPHGESAPEPADHGAPTTVTTVEFGDGGAVETTTWTFTDA